MYVVRNKDCSSGRAGGAVQRTIQSPLNGLHGMQAVVTAERKCTVLESIHSKDPLSFVFQSGVCILKMPDPFILNEEYLCLPPCYLLAEEYDSVCVPCKPLISSGSRMTLPRDNISNRHTFSSPINFSQGQYRPWDSTIKYQQRSLFTLQALLPCLGLYQSQYFPQA